MASPMIINPNFQDGNGGAITGITANTNFGTPANWTKSGTGFSRSGHVIPHGSITIPKHGTHCLVLGEDRTPNTTGTEVINADTQSYTQSIDFTYLSFLRIAFEAHNFTADSNLYFELKWGTTFFYTVATANFSFQGGTNKNYAEHIAVPSSAPTGTQNLNINLRNSLTGTRTKPSIYISHIHPVRMPRFGSMRFCDTNLMKTAYDTNSANLTVSHGTASKGNLVDNAVNKCWTSGAVTAGTDITISIDLGSAQFVNFAAIINHNCPSPNGTSVNPDTYYLEGSATSNFNAGSPEVSFPFRFKANNMYVESNNTPFEYQYWRIRLDADAVTAHNISIGEIVIGLDKEMLTNYAWEHAIVSSYKNNVYETQWGEKFTYQRHRQDMYQLNFNDIRDATMFQIQALLNDNIYGSTNPLTIIPDPRKRECLFGRFQNEISQQILYRDYNRTNLIFTTEPIGVQLTA